MKHFYGTNKKSTYFEGWYFKQHNHENMLALIPGISINGDGSKKAFIQFITNTGSFQINFPYEDFHAETKRLFVRVDKSYFSPEGIYLDIQRPNLEIHGQLNFKNITPLKYSAMGVFSMFKFMECNHDVLSLNHEVDGVVNINGKNLDFSNSRGYIEKDYGKSFPKKYIWLQCNGFEEKNVSIMVSVATIPFMATEFTGLISIVYYRGKQYRIATYNGGAPIVVNNNKMIVKNNNYMLRVNWPENIAYGLSAPVKGEMSRTINECPIGEAKFTFYKKNKEIFTLSSDKASIETVDFF